MPTDVSITNVQTTSFEVIYDPPAAGRHVVVEYKESDQSWNSPTEVTDDDNTLPFQVALATDGADAGKSFDVRAKTEDSTHGDASRYTETMRFTAGQ